MPKLRRLTGQEVVAILEQLGYEVIRVKGSHHRMKLVLDEKTCYTTVPVHGRKPLPTGTLQAILRQVALCVSEDDLKSHFYVD